MQLWFRSRTRHPFFPGLAPIPACKARGRVLALSGTYKDLEVAAVKGISVQNAVFVLLDWNAAPFTPEQRDCLWKLFQTPVYAILMGSDGRIAGFECEVQNGFHAPGKPIAGDETVCECGRPGPFLHTGSGHAPAGKSRLAVAGGEAL